MTTKISIPPFTRPVRGRVRIPGSKSITNRALLLAALSENGTQLQEALFSEDTEVMVDCLEKLGFHLREDHGGRSIYIEGQGGKIPNHEASLYFANAGTAARFVTALCALHPNGTYHLDGSEAMRKRPMRGLLQALTAQGATVQFLENEGFFPLILKTKGLTGGPLTLDASASSQILSALLMVAPYTKEPFSITLEGKTVSEPFVQMTLSMMEQFGYSGATQENSTRYTVHSQAPYTSNKSYTVEPDATAASYFMALPLVTRGTLAIENLSTITLQGDIVFANVLESLGFSIDRTDTAWTFASPLDLEDKPQTFDFNSISDTFLTLAALAPLFPQSLTLDGLAHTRHQETDRIHAMETELKRLGQKVSSTDGSITIEPEPLHSATIQTYHDHRVAMSFGILGCLDLNGDGTPWITIDNPDCCAKTFPNFFETLASLHARAHAN